MEKQTKYRKNTDAIANSGKYKPLLFEILRLFYENSRRDHFQGNTLKIWGSDESEPDFAIDKNGKKIPNSLGAMLWEEGFHISRKSLRKHVLLLEQYFAQKGNDWVRILGINFEPGKKGHYLMRMRFSSQEIDGIYKSVCASTKRFDSVNDELLERLKQYCDDLKPEPETQIDLHKILASYRLFETAESREDELVKTIGTLILDHRPFETKVILGNGDHFASRYGDRYLPISVLASDGHYYLLALAFIDCTDSLPEPCLISIKDIKEVKPLSFDELICPGAESGQLVRRVLEERRNNFVEVFDVRAYLRWHPVLKTSESVELRLGQFHLSGFEWDEETEQAIQELGSVAEKWPTIGEHGFGPDDRWETSEPFEMEEEYAMGFAMKYAHLLTVHSVSDETFDDRLKRRMERAQKMLF